VASPRFIALGVETLAVRTPTLPPATRTNCFALGTRDLIIVEPAPSDPAEQRSFASWVHDLAARGMKPLAIVCTHHHADHAGGSSWAARALGLPMWAHAATADRLPDVTFARRLSDGDRIELDGPVRQVWRVLHTPGHAPGHVCLHEERSDVIVLGDMIASEGTILIAPGDGDMAEYLAQLRRLEALGARLGLPAHGEPVDDVSRHLRRTYDHRLMRERKVIEAVEGSGARGMSTQELLERAYDDTPMLLWSLAKLSLEAHLGKLVREARVDARGDRWYASRQGAR